MGVTCQVLALDRALSEMRDLSVPKTFNVQSSNAPQRVST